ncbi:MAG: TadG family pilus assembly protein [Thermoguttaceae bacterium]
MYEFTRKKMAYNRRAAVLVLSAVLMVALFAFVAFAIDLGYLVLSRTELQNAADAAALAACAYIPMDVDQATNAAETFANSAKVAGKNVENQSVNVEYGTWDLAYRRFTAGTPGNAVRVTVERTGAKGGQIPLFFARIFGMQGQNISAHAVAMTNPRDIAFVVDLSGSMNDDTDPDYGSSTDELIQNVYDDFGFGTIWGSEEYAGEQLGVPNNSSWVDNLTKGGGPLRSHSIDARYRVKGSDSSSTKTWKAYAWVMEVQLGGVTSQSGITPIMPNAIPVPNADDSANYNYWKSYIDSNRRYLGYKSYEDMMMDKGRDGTCGGSHTPLSLQSELCACPMHTETVEGELFSFPPREMPCHAVRRALIAALQVIRDRNQSVSDVNQKDWVSIIQFDSSGREAILLPLTDDYNAATQVCPSFQAAGSTCTEAGLSTAREHIKPASQGGAGREHANKIIVLLTDGMPNQKQSSSWTINDYISDHPSDDWYSGGSNATDKNAALMQTSMMQGYGWYAFAAGIGGGCDYDFMDRVARMGNTANVDGQSPRGSGDPSVYEAVLRQIFHNIITNPKLRLVQ